MKVLREGLKTVAANRTPARSYRSDPLAPAKPAEPRRRIPPGIDSTVPHPVVLVHGLCGFDRLLARRRSVEE